MSLKLNTNSLKIAALVLCIAAGIGFAAFGTPSIALGASPTIVVGSGLKSAPVVPKPDFEKIDPRQYPDLKISDHVAGDIQLFAVAKMHWISTIKDYATFTITVRNNSNHAYNMKALVSALPDKNDKFWFLYVFKSWPNTIKKAAYTDIPLSTPLEALTTRSSVIAIDNYPGQPWPMCVNVAITVTYLKTKEDSRAEQKVCANK